jgi:hypothetical protein
MRAGGAAKGAGGRIRREAAGALRGRQPPLRGVTEDRACGR